MALGDFDAHAFDINWKPTPSPVKEQAGIYDDLTKGYAGAIAGQDKTPQLIDRYDTRFGVPDLQTRVQRGTEQSDYLGNQITNLPTDIAQRSRESILTQGQKNRQVQAESAPLYQQKGMIDQNLSRDQASLGVAQTNASRMVTAEQVDQEKELAPWLKKYDTEAIMSGMRETSWTFENQKELDRLLANQQAGVTMSEGERGRLKDLAVAEKQFQQAVQVANINASATRLTALASLGKSF